MKKIKNIIKAIAIKKGYRLNTVSYFDFFNSMLYQLLKSKDRVNFVQIGANDGKRFDPLYEFIKYNKEKIYGFVFEPVKDYFNDLKENYKDYPNVKPINLAIHNELQETIIYRVSKIHENIVPEFALGIASFNQEHHKKTNIPSEYIVEEKVKCIALEIFIIQNNINNLDVLLLDTEGYDYDIIKNLNFNKINPTIIHFEHGLKSETMSKTQFLELKDLLYKQDYQLFVDKSDVTAIKTMMLYD